MHSCVAMRTASCGRYTISFAALVLVFAVCVSSPLQAATNYTIVGWNNLGMHCMDSDYSVFSILPPYNTIQAHVIQIINNNTNVLMTTTNGFTVTYEAVTDPDGSFNSTSQGKGNFWDYVQPIYGVALPPDFGLPVPGPNMNAMPGTGNVPQRMGFETAFNWFISYGIPITPYDDSGKPNQYPMMRLRLKNNAGTTLATTDIVLPVSDEMDCKLCHSSGSGPAARPTAGWLYLTDPGRDYRLNILKLHDDREGGTTAFQTALAAAGFNSGGLYPTVAVDHRPILCAACHLSEALPGSGQAGIRPLTRAVHARHASVVDPRNGLPLDTEGNRTACYTCHPGSATRCLRGAMGKSVAADGSMAMQCQSCHGSMTLVGSATRTGWLNEPNCQACHVGTATNSLGVIRYTSAFDSPGHLRNAAEQTFATNPDTPAAGISLYRFSSGHGGLQCSACHGSTHAEFPSAFRNDNIQNETLQGHAGMIVECEKCHGNQPANSRFHSGPHGMHPMTSSWAQNHPDITESGGRQQCQPCHGTDYRGTVLSRVQKDGRTVTTDKFGSRTYWRGQQISCYGCHDGANSSNPTTRGFPTANNTGSSTVAGQSVAMALTGSGVTGWRIVSQPANGTVALSGTTATYFPEVGYSGTDTFTFAASNGYNDSNLATGTVSVALVYSNGDGVPDWWRALHFGGDGTTVDSQSCGTCDPDRDGYSNSDEFIAKTDPLDRRSAPRIFAIQFAGNDVRLGFVSSLGQEFAVDRRNDLQDAWTPLTTNLWGKTDTTSFTDPGGKLSPQRFYRVRIVP
jgi:hypothetical protein